MSAYRVVLFLHVAGAIATFAGIGAWFFGVVALRRARRAEEVRALAPIFEMGAVLTLIGIVVVALAGLYLAVTGWSLRVGWIQVAIGAFVLLAPVGPLVVGLQLERIIRDARTAGDAAVPPAFLARLRDPALKLGMLVITGDLAGIVFVMTTKPSFRGAIVAIAAFIALGLALAVPPVAKAISVIVEGFSKLEESNPFIRWLGDRR